VLDVEGGAGNDAIQVFRDLHKGGNYVVDVNGARSTFSTLAVSRILVFGNRRGDEILIGQTGPHIGLGVVAVGGGGDDVVRGGDGNDTIVSDARDRDTLWGGDGDDSFTGAFVIDGGNGDDTVAGYAGIGTFTGGAGHDRLISGFMRSQLPSHFLDFDSAEDTYAIFPPS
jgi:Ca2+-binding RTX toxin-like protein